MNQIELRHVSLGYDNHPPVIEDLSLEIKKGEFVTLIGESGSGKTTLLKSINGLIPLLKGEMKVLGRSIDEWDHIQLRRQIGYVIQSIGLFPHMTIEDNILYVLKLTRQDTKHRAAELLELVGIENAYLSRYPRELSGGQKQRIGVARALAAQPDLLLMDEPFGAVDEITRSKLQDELLLIQKQLGTTLLFVTHDVHEALKLGQTLILFKDGQIVEKGTRHDMIFNHKDEYTRSFFGFKHISAYFNTTAIRQFGLSLSPEDETLKTLTPDTLLIEVVELMAKGHGSTFNVRNQGQYLGQFTFGKSST